VTGGHRDGPGRLPLQWQDQGDKVAEVLSLTGFLHVRVETAGLDARRSALAYFYPFFCPLFQSAVTRVRESLWARATAPFPFDPESQERDWWHPPSPFLTRQIPRSRLRWIMGEDLPGGPTAPGGDYRRCLNPMEPQPAWLQSIDNGLEMEVVRKFDATYALVPWAERWLSGEFREGLLFDHTWMMEYARSNTPPLPRTGQLIAIDRISIRAGKGLPIVEPHLTVTIFSRSVSGQDVAVEYERFLQVSALDQPARVFEGWPGGLPEPCGPVSISGVRQDLNWVVPSVAFEVRPPWPSTRLIAAYATEVLARDGGHLAATPTKSEASYWLRALATTALVTFAGSSSRRAITTWNNWARGVEVPSGCAPTVLWSDIEREISPAEQYLSRERKRVLEIMDGLASQGLCSETASPAT
jgi:hypothetical protein